MIYLIVALLIKFALFQAEGDRKWLLPANIDPLPTPTLGHTFRGRYRSATKNAIDECSANSRRWMVLAQIETDFRKKNNVVWRDGMGDHILELLRMAAWKRVDGLLRRYFFEVDMDDDLTVATVGKMAVKQKDVPKMEDKGVAESVELRQSQGDGYLSNTSSPLVSAATTLPILTSNASLGQSRSFTTEVDPPDHPSPSSLDKLEKQPHISAIFFLGPPEMKDSWEYKLIDIQNQSTQATLFNMRRLFPITAEWFFTRFGKGNAIAVQASVLHVTTVLFHMLRLANYLEGCQTANYTVEEKALWDQKEKERRREEKLERMRDHS